MKSYRAPSDLLKERVILVTGAGDGIGRAAANRYGSHGATVVLLGRTVKKLESVYDEIVAAGGPEPAIYPMDLVGATPDHYEELAQRLSSDLGRLDGLLNNAGSLGSMTSLESYDPKLWFEVMQVNVNAAFLLTRACLPLLKRSGDASIVFTSSGVGRKGRAYWGAFSVSKFAVEGMTQVLADELENTPGIRANCINPGATRTAMRAVAYPAEDPNRLATPEELMPLYLYLMGPDSRELNGRSLDAQ